MTSFKKKSLPILSLLLVLSLTLLLLVVRGYCFSKQFYEGHQDNSLVVQLKEVPSSIESTEITLEQLIILADNRLAIPNEPAVYKERTFHRAVFKEEGGSLYSLSLKYYQKANETLFDLILQANPNITDVRQINDDQEIILPIITPESYITRVSGGLYRVHVGTFETTEMANLYSDKVSDLKKVLILESHKFSPQDTWCRLMASSFTDKGEALKTVNLLREQGIIYIPPVPR